jgi:hypothetical protein
MRNLKRFLTRLAAHRRKAFDEERLAQEIEEHLALQTEENQRSGLSRGEARRQAVLKFGAVQAIKEDYRDRQRLPLLERVQQNVRFGFRQLSRKFSLSTTILLTLALGIGANTASAGSVSAPHFKI